MHVDERTVPRHGLCLHAAQPEAWTDLQSHRQVRAKLLVINLQNSVLVGGSRE
jgi:hypothetical protein